jgi:hypothetical protein
MYCPGCGKENSEQQRFCRSCGLNLQTIFRAAGSELSRRKQDTFAEIAPREYKGWQNPLLYGFFMLVLGSIITVIGKKIFREQTLADIGTVTALLGACLMGLKGLMLAAPQWFGSLPKEPLRVELSSNSPRSLNSGEPPSITENTTKHLDTITEERSRDTQPTS